MARPAPRLPVIPSGGRAHSSERDRDEASDSGFELHPAGRKLGRGDTEAGELGLVAKVPRTRLYRPTRYGNRVITAAISIHDRRFPTNYLAAA